MRVKSTGVAIRLRVRMALCVSVMAFAVHAQPRPGTEQGPLHVASPDWRDAVIYFLMVDRFDDGDSRNNDQGAGEFDPRDGRRFSGGDLRGVTRRLDYIQGLGASAVWITPPVANQWWNPRQDFGGYHGYWTRDFSAIDAHFGNKNDYIALSRALHGRDMHLVQDVVVNHTANYGDWEGMGAARQYVLRADSQGFMTPSQPPFDRNDYNDPDQRAQGIYHWTGDIADFTVEEQEQTFALAGLDDLNTENAEVRRALRASYGMWIRDVGVDAFRIDTAFHVPREFFADFLQAGDVDAPGIERVARATGRTGFLSFGEGFGSDKPFADVQARKLDAYMRTPGGLPSMINFPMHGALGDVFARGQPTAVLGHRIASTMRVHADPHRMPTFVDNHDVDRFLAGGDLIGLQQALLAMLTLPGIPTIYYGTEQALTTQRPAMFAAGFESGGRDRFDTQSPMYRFLQRAIGLRRADTVFSRGAPTVLRTNAAGPGAIAWRMEHEGRAALVAINTAPHPVLVDALEVGAGAPVALVGAFSLGGTATDHVSDADGRLHLVLPPRSAQVWRVAAAAMTGAAVAEPARLEVTHGGNGTVSLQGVAAPGSRLEAIVDGDLSRAQPITPDARGRWSIRLDTDGMLDASIDHRAVVRNADTGAVSAPALFKVQPHWQAAGQVHDPRDDDTGRTGRYRPPTGDWSAARTLDIERVDLARTGRSLRIEVTMREISTVWNPSSGFDHLALTTFIELPGAQDGAAVMPLQDASLPVGMRWHRRIRAHGWSNALFAPASASATNEGTPVAGGARLEVDAARRTITFTLPAEALGTPATLDGARVHVTTWDYDGGYRALAPEAAPGVFGGAAAGSPKVMDSATVRVH